MRLPRFLVVLLSIMSLLDPGIFFVLAATMPTKVFLDVPFTSQAPRSNWKDPRQQAGCEEASVLMAMKWVQGKKITSVAQAEKEIIAMAEWEKKQYGDYHDTSAADTAKRLVKEYFKHDNATVQYDITVDDIKVALVAGNLVIVPVNGRLLKNPHFTRPGPLEHMVLIRGYDDIAQEFITNDPGTWRGKGYRYTYNILINAVRDYPTGNHEEIKQIRKAMIVVGRD